MNKLQQLIPPYTLKAIKRGALTSLMLGLVLGIPGGLIVLGSKFAEFMHNVHAPWWTTALVIIMALGFIMGVCDYLMNREIDEAFERLKNGFQL